ncbi:c-type cytochrome [Membranihabitans marinus]|uniref:c-type cytochrome n=1 Tax=Membranihabitans marinus TaxID=1227546 RepID=UPI001F2FF617|nr:c-type cytochrome [Membranihabitans marinus]
MRKVIYSGVIILAVLLMGWQKASINFTLSEDMPLAEIVEQLEGKPNPYHPDESLEGVSAESGRELFFEGETKQPGSFFNTRRVSKYFTCNACHNTEREDADLTNLDPEARLQYVIDNNLPFLPGTTLWGAVNREEFYNDDYFKKYGQLVYPARDNLREAIQLCAIECSQGRPLEKWEVESILAYFWEIDLKIGDLDLSESEKLSIEKAIQDRDPEQSSEVLKLLKTKYPLKSPATFLDPPSTKEERIFVSGDPIRGQHIFKSSCQYCHYDNNFSFFELNDDKMTMKYLYRHLADYDIKSVYQVLRYGTPPKAGKYAYMPQYTEERMSKAQVVDLITYIRREAGKL